MREWVKYAVVDAATLRGEQGDGRIPFPERLYAQEVDEVKASQSFRSKEVFFKTFFHEIPRVQNYDHFISENISQCQKVLGVGSGRCANELILLERGYQVTCSDVRPTAHLAATRQLFPRLDYECLDILAGSTSQTYDVVVALGVVFAFNDDELWRFFANIRQSLNQGGHLILDSSSSPDNFMSYLIHDVLLKYEAKAARMLKAGAYPRPRAVAVFHHGYRRKTREILSIARECGFILVSQRNYDFLTEFE